MLSAQVFCYEDKEHETSETYTQVTTFADLGLSENILRAIADVGYNQPTPIQEQAIPIVLMGRDLLAVAQTGTGKTASFVLPMLEILGNGRARARMPRSLILEPTRELAAQVADNFRTYGKYHNLSMALLVGGETMDEQIRNLDRGVDVVIATPGRLLDLHDRGRIMLNDIRVFVIDEADRMLDMGFIPDIEKIAGLLPPLKQTLFLSATMPNEIKRLTERFLSNPKSVSVAPQASTAANVKQYFVMVPSSNDWLKRETLRSLLGGQEVQNAFIFCNRKKDVALLQKSLAKHGFSSGALHGDLEQSERTATLDKFKRNEIKLLVCSDVAARGLDVADVSHVFNFDVPFNADDYVHRIGRTGRAGRSGVSYTLVTPDEDKQVAAIESLTKQTPERMTVEGLAEPMPEQARSSRHEGRGRDDRRNGSKRGEGPRDSHKSGKRHGMTPPERIRPPVAAAVQAAPLPRAEPVAEYIPANESDKFQDDLPAFLRKPVPLR